MHRTGNRKRFSDLSGRKILALAISPEEDDDRIYRNRANFLRADYPAWDRVRGHYSNWRAWARPALTDPAFLDRHHHRLYRLFLELRVTARTQNRWMQTSFWRVALRGAV